MRLRVGRGGDRLRVVARALHEGRRVGFTGMRKQPFRDIQQFAHAGATARGHEADRHQVALAQALLEGIVQFLPGEPVLAEVEVMVHDRLVDLDHLVDDLAMPVGDRAEVAVAGGLPEAVDDRLAAFGGQVERQHFAAEGLAQAVQQRTEFRARMIDLVDHDHPAEIARLGVLHHPVGTVADAGVGIDHHRHRLHCGQCGQGGATEIRIAGGVDQVDVDRRLPVRGVVDAGDRGVDGMAAFAFDRIEVGDRAAAFDGACRLDGAAGMQQGFEQGGLAGAGVACQGHVADLLCAVGHEPVPPSRANGRGVMAVRASRRSSALGGRSWRT